MKIFGKLSICICLFCLAIYILPLCSCDDNPLDEENKNRTRIFIASGNNQEERVTAVLPQPLKVKVTDLLGHDRPGVTVTFSTADATASLTPPQTTTDANGFASSIFKLGHTAGTYLVGVTANEDSATFTATAVDPECPEESLVKISDWPGEQIFITTTSSSLLDGSGSVLIICDPENGTAEKVLETTESIVDLAFSSRGELYLTSRDKIFKVNPHTKTLEEFASYAASHAVEIEPNQGGILTGVIDTEIFTVHCAAPAIRTLYSQSNALPECLAVNPLTRNFYYVSGSAHTYQIIEREWDGRTAPGTASVHDIYTPTAEPAGMCVDSTGTIYITLDGNDYFRTIGRLTADGAWEENFFDFYAHGGNNLLAGRWGDITLLGENLYLIDRRNNRLVVISTSGEWVKAYQSEIFSRLGEENERYGITASRTWDSI
ncbi:MAG: hypothetical protein JXB45_08530 [Candidatus Krumholzibacteriota bacterium]|nr:hypothetical protein [Candidatus Krumholzibacteriota bacterium]